jgi:hypothetical protein
VIDPGKLTLLVADLLRVLDGNQTPKEGEAAVRRELDRLVCKWREEEEFWAGKWDEER